MKDLFRLFLSTLAVLTLVGLGGWALAEEQDCFSSSLHHTGEGMRYWYEADDGFMAITGTPYQDLGCKGCHVEGCNTCHLEQTDERLSYSGEKARSSKTCLKCHAREKATIKYDEMVKCPGVHAKAFMTCMDCHSTQEVHGNGKVYHSMRQPTAMDAACTNCHTTDSDTYPTVPQTRSHTVHGDELTCNACHVQNTIACYNCHFGVLAETKSKPKSFATKVKDFLLLVKYRGQVTSGTMQTLVGKQNEPFITYVPYFTHSVMSEGRQCEGCHGTEAATTLAASKDFTPATFSNGKLEFYKGVIPLVPGLLNWPFLEKKDGQWIPFEPTKRPLIQMGVYAEPFTQEELKKLASKQVYKE
jgi:hypothetical protein